jgi:hypothetical protein
VKYKNFNDGYRSSIDIYKNDPYSTIKENITVSITYFKNGDFSYKEVINGSDIILFSEENIPL